MTDSRSNRNIMSVSWGDHLEAWDGDDAMDQPDKILRCAERWQSEFDAGAIYWREMRSWSKFRIGFTPPGAPPRKVFDDYERKGYDEHELITTQVQEMGYKVYMYATMFDEGFPLSEGWQGRHLRLAEPVHHGQPRVLGPGQGGPSPLRHHGVLLSGRAPLHDPAHPVGLGGLRFRRGLRLYPLPVQTGRPRRPVRIQRARRRRVRTALRRRHDAEEFRFGAMAPLAGGGGDPVPEGAAVGPQRPGDEIGNRRACRELHRPPSGQPSTWTGGPGSRRSSWTIWSSTRWRFAAPPSGTSCGPRIPGYGYLVNDEDHYGIKGGDDYGEKRFWSIPLVKGSPAYKGAMERLYGAIRNDYGPHCARHGCRLHVARMWSVHDPEEEARLLDTEGVSGLAIGSFGAVVDRRPAGSAPTWPIRPESGPDH